MTPEVGPARLEARACTDLVLNLTLRCPLRCAHCCYRAGGRATETMSPAVMEGAIRAAAALGTVRTVHFSGGDPFVVPGLLLDGVRLAAGLGLRAAAVTSAWFAATRSRALAALEPLARAGLGELCVSYDDMHAAYLPADHLVNTMAAVGELGLEALVSVVVEPKSLIDAAWVRGLLAPLRDGARIRVYEMAVNTTGRAADLGDADTRRGRAAAGGVYLGPCRQLLGTVQVVHDGRVFPCCGTLPHTPAMAIGRADGEGALARALAEAARDPLWEAIASRGPVEVLVQATAGSAHHLRPEDFDGVCTACDRLFTEPGLLELARERCAASRVSAPRKGRTRS